MNKRDNMLEAYPNKAALLDAYSKANGEPDSILASMISVYVPHIYRGGYMIRGFGYSTERIGAVISAEIAGTPE